MSLTEDVLKSNTFPFWTSTSEIDVIVTCPECLKKLGLEHRFIAPVLPRTIECPYCGHAISITKIGKAGEEK